MRAIATCQKRTCSHLQCFLCKPAPRCTNSRSQQFTARQAIEQTVDAASLAKGSTTDAMISTLVPTGAVAVSATPDDWLAEPLPEEERLVKRAVDRRRREFAVGRRCARRALAHLGGPTGPILAGDRREPVWPKGFIGSITHCEGYCGAAVARTSSLVGLGIDAERNRPLTAAVRTLVASPCELTDVEVAPGVDPALVVFSAKESFYKAWFPATRRELGFLDVEVGIDWAGHTFSVHGTDRWWTGAHQPHFTGRFALTDSHVFTVTIARYPL